MEEDDANEGYLPEDLVLAARREEIALVHSEDVYESVPTQDCKDAGKKLLDLMWVDTDKSVDPRSQENRSRLCQRIQDEECERESNKRMDAPLHTSTHARVGALIWSHPGDWITRGSWQDTHGTPGPSRRKAVGGSTLRPRARDTSHRHEM